MEDLKVALPWQMIVDMFYDDEGHSEWICETDEEGEEDCWEEWVEAPEPPEVDEASIVEVPGVAGTLHYTLEEDVFELTDMSLGESTTLVSVDSDTIITLDLNPEDGRSMDLAVRSNTHQGVGFEFSPSVDAQLTMAWHKVSSVFEDLPRFLMDESLGAQMDGTDTPALDILRSDDTEIQMTSGRLTLWSSEMDEDVVIQEGECITSIDDSHLSKDWVPGALREAALDARGSPSRVVEQNLEWT